MMMKISWEALHLQVPVCQKAKGILLLNRQDFEIARCHDSGRIGRLVQQHSLQSKRDIPFVTAFPSKT